MNLSPFVGRMVVLQIKQPYVYQFVRANGEEPVPLTLTKEGQLGKPGERDVSAMVTSALVGKLVACGEAHCLLEVDEPTGAARKIEIMFHADLVACVTALGEEKRIKIIS
jgi:hypothetical protein